MATDATGTPTSLGIPTYDVNSDAPTGNGFNAAMASIDTLIKARVTDPSTQNDGEPLVWDNVGKQWVPVHSKINDSTKFLRGDGTWVVPSGIPTGALTMFGATVAPSGWLLCDGSAVSRTSFSALFGVLATTYGVGDGSTTFNVPDLRGRVPVGLGTNGSVSSLNQNDGQTVANRRPHHRTSMSTISYRGSSGTNGTNAFALDAVVDGAIAPPGLTIGTSNASDALDTPSFIVVNYIIKT